MAQSTLPLAIAGTLAVHLIIAVVVDAASVIGREEKTSTPTKIRLVEINTDNVQPEVTPEPDPVPQPVTKPDTTMPRTVRPSPRSPRTQQVTKTSTPMPQTDAPA